MAKEYFNVERGFQIDDTGVAFISGTGAPGGSGDADTVGVGSQYLDDSTGFLYMKVTAGTGADKWRKQANQDDVDAVSSGTTWREPAIVKDDTLYANLAAAESAMNAGTVDGVAVSTGDRILYTNITGENANVYVVTGTVGAGATLVEDDAAVDGFTVWVEQGTTAADTLWVYDGAAWIQRGSGDQTELAFIRTFIGKSAAGSETPAYASEVYITDGQDLETAISNLDAQLALTEAKAAAGHTQTNTLAVGSATVVDSVNVDLVAGVKWILHAQGSLEVEAGRKTEVEILAVHNGHNTGAGADASSTDFNVSGKLRIGSNLGLSYDVVLSGSGAGQTMELEVTPSGTNVDVRVVREIIEF